MGREGLTRISFSELRKQPLSKLCFCFVLKLIERKNLRNQWRDEVEKQKLSEY